MRTMRYSELKGYVQMGERWRGPEGDGRMGSGSVEFLKERFLQDTGSEDGMWVAWGCFLRGRVRAGWL